MKNITIAILFVAFILTGCTTRAGLDSFTESQALQFLYQYMPLGDSVDYSENYFRECIDYAFQAKEEMPWGPDIPEREFKHFVLPVRVNNEGLDRFRATYYEELRGRVGNLSLYDAALEVNHWCHEHVNYKGSDSRTSAPMATIKTSWGRCGEESTLLVTALRTVCIPARQVYTPRWAHCDDNHAWVEAWVDGEWHFMGACEPEPTLDLGWFNEPASRALLLHTRVFGDYDGPEEVISRTKNYTEINVIDNYAKANKTTFTVVDGDNQPLPDVNVEFKIYNYAEYCTVASKTTDSNGETHLTTGMGSMMAYAAKDGLFGFQVFNPRENDHVTIVLDHKAGTTGQFDCDIYAPVPNAKIPEVTPEMRAKNDQRVNHEDVLRNTYVKSCKNAQAKLIAKTGNKTLGSIFEKTWGNHQTIGEFVEYAQEKNAETKAVSLLQNITDKDLRDVSLDVLCDHFDYTPNVDKYDIASDLYAKYILSPRISNEQLVPNRKTLSSFFKKIQVNAFRENPERLANWVRENIRTDDELNPQRIPISPLGVLKARAADRHSRDIFFVAMARSLGIAAQINPINGNVQYLAKDGRTWENLDLDNTAPSNSTTGYLNIRYTPTKALPDPKYYSHFSIKKFDGQSFKLLAYDAQDPGIDDGLNLSSFGRIPLEPGFYILTSGTRLSNGNVLASSQFFNIEENKTTRLELTMRTLDDQIHVVGTINAGMTFIHAENEQEQALTTKGEKGFVLALLDQGSEPTTHTMQDIVMLCKQFEQTKLPMYFLFDNEEEYEKFKLKGFSPLPSNACCGIQKNLKETLTDTLKLNTDNLPIFLIVNANDEVVFVNQGYRIGLAEQLIKISYLL